MLIEFSPSKPLSDVRETNDFLRRTWACLRDDAKIFFQYAPWLDSQSQVQHIGFVSLSDYSEILIEKGVGGTVSCSFSYKKRGVVDKLIFEIPESWRICVNTEEVRDLILGSLSKVDERRPNISRLKVSAFTPLQLSIPTVSGEKFKLEGGIGEAEIEFSVDAYDEVDFQHQTTNFAWNFCVLASAWSGQLFFLQNSPNALADYKEIINLIHDRELTESLNQLSDPAFSIAVDLLASGSSAIMPALKASHLIQRSLIAASSSCNLLGDTANTLAISALEVLSDEGADPISCKTCGQPQYKISKRVRDFAADHLGGEHWSKWFGDQYAARSKFLHTGAIRHRSFGSGRANPTVQASAPGGMALPMNFAYDHVLTHLTLLIFRNYIQRVAELKTGDA